MTKQESFFLSTFEEYQQDHPELLKKKPSQGSRSKTIKQFNCTSCGLEKKCLSGRIERYGKGKKNILIVGFCPDRTDDKEGVPLVGSEGVFLKSSLQSLGIDMYRDCVRTNIVQCSVRKKNSKGRVFYGTPTNEQIKCCSRFFEKDIEEVQPKLIICLGGEVLNAVLPTHSLKKFNIFKIHGKTFPSQVRNCWVGGSFQPSYIFKGNRRELALFNLDLSNIVKHVDKPLSIPLTKEGNILVQDFEESLSLIKKMSDSTVPVSFDYECTCLSPFEKNAKILTVSLSNDISEGYCLYLDNPNWNIIEQAAVYQEFKQFLLSDAPKVVQNINMEEPWGIELVGAQMNNFYWDTMVTCHALNCRKGTTSLGFQVFEMTGHEYKEMVDVKNLKDEPIENLSDYNCWDARYQLMAYYDQVERLDHDQAVFNDLLHKALPSFSHLKHRGIHIDKKVLDDFFVKYTNEVEEQLSIILETPGALEYKKIYGNELNVNSTSQVGKILYEIYRMSSIKNTKTGREAADEDTLNIILKSTKDEKVSVFLKALLRYRKIFKFVGKIEEFKREMDSNNYIHPSYNLNTAESFRSSANGPQVHNIYKRDEELKKFRKVFIPSPGNVFLESDYDALEVKVIAMASQDKVLTAQIAKGLEWDQANPEGKFNPYDPHRRWAAEIYQKNFELISEEERYNTKNGMIFPSFYGSVVSSICRTFPDINPKHIERVQEKFWKEYAGVKEWQKTILAIYAKDGFVRGLSGFKRPGPLSNMQLYNTPIQGTAFHLLLDALWRIDEKMIADGMKSRIISEVHDSLLFDTDPDEIEAVIELAETIMCSKRFDWQTVPLSVSWEYGLNWYEMEKF